MGILEFILGGSEGNEMYEYVMEHIKVIILIVTIIAFNFGGYLGIYSQSIAKENCES